MESSVQWTFFFLLCLEFIIGTFTNIFIIFRLFISYWRHQHTNGCEKIIAALCISYLCYTWLTFINILLFSIWPTVTQIFTVLYYFIFFIVVISNWLTVSLCFYYYIKIKNFSSSLLSRLKLKINALASWMILGSVLLSLFCSLLNMLQLIVQEKSSNASFYLKSISISNENSNTNLYISFASTLTPLCVSVSTTASTAWSLHLHKLKMVRNPISSSSDNVRKYEGAFQIMICLLAFYPLIYTAMCLYYFNIFDYYSPGFWALLLIICSHSPLHSILLSLSTTKLKKAWLRILTCNAESTDDHDIREE